MSGSFAAVLVCVAVGLVAGAPAQAAPVVGPNVNVGKIGADIGEPAIAVDPNDPQHVFVSGTTGFYRFSTDGGATWSTPSTDFTTDGGDGGDTSLSWDTYGNLFLTFLDTGVYAKPTKTGHVTVWLSTDGGQNFTNIATLGTGVSSGDIDQPSVTTGDGMVWVCWRGADGKIQASGANVTGLGSGNVGAFTAPEEAGAGNFGDIAIGPTGIVMVTYQRDNSPTHIYEETDTDGTGSGGFGSEVKVSDTNVGGFYPIPPQNARTVDSEASLAWDRSGGSHNGRVYLAYTDTPSAGSVDTNIFVRHSDDNGGSWSGPTQVNDDGGTNSQFLPAIALDQTTGKLALGWYDSRNDGGSGGSGDTNKVANDDAQYWGTTSDDGTSFASNFQISSGTSNAADAASGIDYGDYSKVVYQEGFLYPVWSDNSNSTGDNPAGTLKAFDTYSSVVVITKRNTALTYNGDTSVDFNDPATLKATLKDSTTSTGVGGQTVSFTLGSQSCSGTTDANGNVSCTLTPTGNQHPGSYTLTASFAGTTQYASSSASPSFTVNKEESQVTYTGDATTHYHDAFTATATLVDPDGNGPIAGKTVTFTLGGTDTCNNTTDGSGVASCSITPTQSGSQTIVASFAGDTDYKSSTDNTHSVAVTPEETTMTYLAPTVILGGAGSVTLTAKLVEDGTNDSDGDGGSPAPVPAQTVTLSVGSQTCTGTTGAGGNVSCTISSVTVPLGPETVGASFAGNTYYQASSDSKTAIVFAFPSRGAFTLGDVTAGPGSSTVTWWADMWWQINSLTGGAAPSSDKGFAGTITLPSTTPPVGCGSAWTTTGGNSPPPVSGIPSYMGVVVTNSVKKSGNAIGGNSVHIVVVRTNPGYAPTPDHPGTGTIVATFC